VQSVSPPVWSFHVEEASESHFIAPAILSDLYSTPMHRRVLAILLVFTVSVGALLGTCHNGLAICLGDGDQHGPDEVIEHCEHTCSHETEWPAPLPADDHDDGCGCTDLDLAIGTLVASVRHDDPKLPAPAALAILFGLADEFAIGPFRDRPPGVLTFDPGGARRLIVVRSTRLNI
jgi:hypothetical protein